MNVYDFSALSIDGDPIPLTTYRGTVILIVNTASKCGFTHQYEELETMYENLKERGFTILGFPCNQFHNQEPDSNAGIKAFCSAAYHVRFPMFSKIDVNGPQAHPLFLYLDTCCRFEGFNLAHPLGEKLDKLLSKQEPNYALQEGIKWNFTKFVIDRKGDCIKRFEPTTDLSEVEEFIKEQL